MLYQGCARVFQKGFLNGKPNANKRNILWAEPLYFNTY